MTSPHDINGAQPASPSADVVLGERAAGLSPTHKQSRPRKCGRTQAKRLVPQHKKRRIAHEDKVKWLIQHVCLERVAYDRTITSAHRRLLSRYGPAGAEASRQMETLCATLSPGSGSTPARTDAGAARVPGGSES